MVVAAVIVIGILNVILIAVCLYLWMTQMYICSPMLDSHYASNTLSSTRVTFFQNQVCMHMYS